METFSALLAICAGNSPVTGEFLAQRPVTRSFDVFFDLRLTKWFSKQWWGRWFDTQPCPLWRHRNVLGQGHAPVFQCEWSSRGRYVHKIVIDRNQTTTKYRQYVWFIHSNYSASPISCGCFPANNSRKTSIARPLGRGMGVFREFEIWPKFYTQSCCAGCNIVLYCTVIYRQSIVPQIYKHSFSWSHIYFWERHGKGTRYVMVK